LFLQINQAEGSGKLSALYYLGFYPQTQVVFMICFVAVLLKDIFEQGKKYLWERPEVCPQCNHHKVHGHGFTTRYFQGYSSCLHLKCYLCPNCGCVITLRPDTHFSRIRSSKETIRSHLAHRLIEGMWPRSSLSRSCLRHWLANLLRQVAAHLTDAWKDGLLAAFDHLSAKGLAPVSRSI